MGPISGATVYKFNAPSLDPPIPQQRNVRVEGESEATEEPITTNDQLDGSRAAEEERREAYPQYLALEAPPDPHLARLDYIIWQNQHTHSYLGGFHDFHRAQVNKQNELGY